MAEWNAAYRRLDAKSLAALETSDLEIVDRFGHWVRSEGPEFSERLWAATFTEIYKGKPGPPRTVERIRMLTRDVAIVQATATWPAVTLEDGTTIPPHGEIDTFVMVKRGSTWRIAGLNIHNQMRPGTERRGERVPLPGKPPAAK
jgi:ketosteroid isomerase-like protein